VKRNDRSTDWVRTLALRAGSTIEGVKEPSVPGRSFSLVGTESAATFAFGFALTATPRLTGPTGVACAMPNGAAISDVATSHAASLLATLDQPLFTQRI
jgi:hypothetical protein